ncbi:MAG: sn-glycerol-1-phosphate dehydrogenase [Clostridia bacterium]|nr:sn-glycerol-1-phosphate dehydrogenase [Clostridia bacterium]
MTFDIPSPCGCGMNHPVFRTEVVTGAGASAEIPRYAVKLGMKRPYILCDMNTSVFADEIASGLSRAGMSPAILTFQTGHPLPDEKTVGSAFMHYDPEYDGLISVGSGVMNDTGKIISRFTGRPYIVAATAPSMDGYASSTSSMERDGLKISLNSRIADVIVGDTDILKKAPDMLLSAGMGDILAKYVAICEWRISHLINGEYYCEETASLVREAIRRCVANIPGLLKRDEKAVEAVFTGLIMSGSAMFFCGSSRPASGTEHYFSHIWDMRSLAFGTPSSLHGIQCAIGTVETAMLYEKLKKIDPDTQKALDHASSFDLKEWHRKLRDFIGPGAEIMISLENTEKKYDTELHGKRLEKIVRNWEGILRIVEEEIPDVEDLKRFCSEAGCPAGPEDIGLTRSIVPMTFECTKDVRDKYILSRLFWDLGEEAF